MQAGMTEPAEIVVALAPTGLPSPTAGIGGDVSRVIDVVPVVPVTRNAEGSTGFCTIVSSSNGSAAGRSESALDYAGDDPAARICRPRPSVYGPVPADALMSLFEEMGPWLPLSDRGLRLGELDLTIKVLEAGRGGRLSTQAIDSLLARGEW
jgi:hypothetical protein